MIWPGAVIVDYSEVRTAVIYRPINRTRSYKKGGEKKDEKANYVGGGYIDDLFTCRLLGIA